MVAGVIVMLAGAAHAEMKEWQLADLDCPDREDELTCKILTQPLDFKDIPWLNGDQNK